MRQESFQLEYDGNDFSLTYFKYDTACITGCWSELRAKLRELNDSLTGLGWVWVLLLGNKALKMTQKHTLLHNLLFDPAMSDRDGVSKGKFESVS